MKLGFFPKLALDSMRKNGRLYLPYLLTGALMTAVYYILYYLSKAEIVSAMAGGTSTQFVLELGRYVTAIFAVLFLFYTNSFLIRRRKKEFGLYNILGMNKRDLGRILFWETLMTYLAAVGIGMVFGVALSKLSELCLLNLVKEEVAYGFSVSLSAVGNTALLFAALYLVLFLNGWRQVRFSSPAELVHSENVGEKPPKANWLLGLLGVILLGCAYFLSASIEQPLVALLWFFAAVVMVIAATYLIFIAGSVLVCRVLQRNKKYYYNPRHYVSVSSMVYRMKRNGAGLASICILLTMVLVMISSSACLYFGADDCLHNRYPREVCIYAARYGVTPEDRAEDDYFTSATDSILQAYGFSPTEDRLYYEYSITGHMVDGAVEMDLNSATDLSFIDYNSITDVHFVSLADYNRMLGENKTLAPDEALLYSVKAKGLDHAESLRVGDATYQIKETLSDCDLDGAGMSAVCATVFLIVPDLDAAAAGCSQYLDYDGAPMASFIWHRDFNIGGTAEDQSRLAEEISDTLINDHFKTGGYSNLYCSAYAGEHSDFYGTFGGLFFIGILLSAVFLTAAVLIIYYKQLSEGYEDQVRFGIMQKVGMTKEDISRNIRSQMRTVFALPLAFAVLHLAFAFPVIYKLLMLFSLFNLPLFLRTAALCVLLCGLFYGLVYRATARAYYSIVSAN